MHQINADVRSLHVPDCDGWGNALTLNIPFHWSERRFVRWLSEYGSGPVFIAAARLAYVISVVREEAAKYWESGG